MTGGATRALRRGGSEPRARGVAVRLPLRSLPGAAATVLLALVTAGCGASPAQPSGPHLITPAQALAVVRSYWSAEQSANTSLDSAQQDRVEEGVMASVDDATFTSDRTLRQPGNPPSLITALTVYVPYQAAYPAQFLALATATSLYATPLRSLFLFMKDAAAAPWRVASAAGWEDNTAPPNVALDAAGYAELRPLPDASGLSAAPPTLPGAFAQLLRQSTPGGDVTGMAPFGPGPWTAGLIESSHRALVKLPAACGCVPTFTWAATSTPITEYRLDDGGALVLFTIAQDDKRAARMGGAKLVQGADHAAYGGLVAPGSYSAVTYHDVGMFAAIVPPGEGDLISVVGGDLFDVTGATTSP